MAFFATTVWKITAWSQKPSFFTCPNLPLALIISFQEPHRIFEFRVVENPANNNRSEAWDIRLIKEN